MITLIAYYRLWLLGAFLIGLGTAWWIRGRAPRVEDAREKDRISNPPAAAPDDPPDEPKTTPDGGERSAPAEINGDDLTQIKGIDAETASMLNLLGVRQYDEIAGWTDMEVDRMTVLLGTGPGRIAQNEWMEQARLLASGNPAEFEQRFGHL